jgi:hypothetical protein
MVGKPMGFFHHPQVGIMESFHIEKMGYSMQKAKMVYAGSVYIPGEDHWVISKDIFLNIICDSICCFFSTNSDSILFLI